MIIRTTDGYYQSSYFFIYIDSEENLNTLIDNNEPTFIHEYIHFLQDILLPYCIRCNMTLLSNFACINQRALQENEIVRPFNKLDKDCNITREQLNYTWGDSKFISYNSPLTNIRNTYFTIPEGLRVYKYIVDYNSETYQIGARDFLEYIAYRIENKHWNTNVPDLPYKTVDKLFEFYGLSEIPIEVRLCIIEFCLYNDNPMHAFINLFINNHLIKNNKEIFLEYNACINYLLSVHWKSKGGFEESIFSKTKRRLENFNDILTNQYSHLQFSDIKLWINNISSYSEKFLSNRFIFSEMYNMSSKHFFETIQNIVDELGIPMVINKNYVGMSLLPKSYDYNQFVQFYVLNKFMEYVQNMKDACPIVDFCRANGSSFDKICLKNPILLKNKNELCPFMLFLESYGLREIKYKKANPNNT